MLTTLALMIALSDPPSTDASPALPPKPKLICREPQQELGSHIRTSRRCKTAEQWQEEDRQRGEVPATLKVVPGQGDEVVNKHGPGS